MPLLLWVLIFSPQVSDKYSLSTYYMLDTLLGVVGATVKKQTKPWQGSSDGYSVVLISKGSGVDPQSTHECINGTKKRNLSLFSVSLFLVSFLSL